MYKTYSTNNTNSAEQAKSFVHLQQDLWDSEVSSHHPDALVIGQVFDHYHQTLKLRPELSKMLIRRKIDPVYVDQFRIGFADRTLGSELQSPRCILGSSNRGRLQRLGLLKPSGHEFFRGSLVIPYLNNDGQIAGAYGRRPRHQRRSPAYHLFWNTQQVTLFNATKRCLAKSMILCKSAIDALTLLTVGVENVVATMGVRGFNDVQLSRLQKDYVRRVDIAFDNTPTFDHSAYLVAQALASINDESFRVKLPVGMDVNRFAMTQANAAASFNRLLEEAAPFRQHAGELEANGRKRWIKQYLTIDEGVYFYLDIQEQAGKSIRTLNSNRIHLERFQDYCRMMGINRLAKLSSEMLSDYQNYLAEERNIYTGNVISSTTQKERIDTVVHMLSLLHYYGIIKEPPGTVACYGYLIEW